MFLKYNILCLKGEKWASISPKCEPCKLYQVAKQDRFTGAIVVCYRIRGPFCEVEPIPGAIKGSKNLLDTS